MTATNNHSKTELKTAVDVLKFAFPKFRPVESETQRAPAEIRSALSGALADMARAIGGDGK